MKKSKLLLSVFVLWYFLAGAQADTYFQGQIKRSGSNLEFYLRLNPGGSNVTNFRFDNIDFWVRQPIGETVPTFGAPVVNTVDFPGLVITKDPFGVESNPYGTDPGYRLIEWTSPVGNATSSPITYNAGQEYLVFSVPVTANFSSSLQLAGDNENGSPYYFSTTRNTAGIGGVSDYTSHGANGNTSLQLFYTSGSPSASYLSSAPTPGIPGTSFYGLIYNISVLPVTFNSYNANCHEKGATITWSTSTEQNSKQFDVERSEDGNTWRTIGSVPAAGNSADTRTYSYLDLEGGAAFYRIRQTDLDNRSVLTGVKRTSCKSSEFNVVLYPVPAKDNLTVVIRSDRDLRTDLQIIDMKGSILRRMPTQINKGNNTINLMVSELPAGQYMLRSADAGIVIDKKFTVAR